MSQQRQAEQESIPNPPTEAFRQQWIEAVSKMAETEQIKNRIECLERQVAADTLGSWQSQPNENP